MSVRARRIGVLLAAVLGVGLTVSLGNWQLRRAAQKVALADQLAQQAGLSPWRNVDWPCASDATLPLQRPAMLSGHWMGAKSVYLDNRSMDGQTGFFVVTPLRLDPPAACGPLWVLVQRGWVPRDPSDRSRLPAVSAPDDLVQVMGRVVLTPSQAYALGQEPAVDAHASGPLLRQNMSGADWQAWLGRMPAVGALLQTDPSVPSDPDHLKRAWPAPDTGVGKHQAYAAQWFAMALIITGLYVWYQLLRPRRVG